jgi:hypothetical protein
MHAAPTSARRGDYYLRRQTVPGEGNGPWKNPTALPPTRPDGENTTGEADAARRSWPRHPLDQRLKGRPQGIRLDQAPQLVPTATGGEAQSWTVGDRGNQPSHGYVVYE